MGNTCCNKPPGTPRGHRHRNRKHDFKFNDHHKRDHSPQRHHGHHGHHGHHKHGGHHGHHKHGHRGHHHDPGSP